MDCCCVHRSLLCTRKVTRLYTAHRGGSDRRCATKSHQNLAQLPILQARARRHLAWTAQLDSFSDLHVSSDCPQDFWYCHQEGDVSILKSHFKLCQQGIGISGFAEPRFAANSAPCWSDNNNSATGCALITLTPYHREGSFCACQATAERASCRCSSRLIKLCQQEIGISGFAEHRFAGENSTVLGGMAKKLLHKNKRTKNAVFCCLSCHSSVVPRAHSSTLRGSDPQPQPSCHRPPHAPTLPPSLFQARSRWRGGTQRLNCSFFLFRLVSPHMWIPKQSTEPRWMSTPEGHHHFALTPL